MFYDLRPHLNLAWKWWCWIFPFKIRAKGAGLQLYQTKRGNSRHRDDENGMILWFLFDLSTFCPYIFCKIMKFKIINCLKKIGRNLQIYLPGQAGWKFSWALLPCIRGPVRSYILLELGSLSFYCYRYRGRCLQLGSQTWDFTSIN